MTPGAIRVLRPCVVTAAEPHEGCSHPFMGDEPVAPSGVPAQARLLTWTVLSRFVPSGFLSARLLLNQPVLPRLLPHGFPLAGNGRAHP